MLLVSSPLYSSLCALLPRPCCLQAEEFLGVPLTPPKKGDAFPTPGRRQCTHKYIMVWDVFWEFPAFWVSYGPREDIPPLTSDQSEKLIVFRERIPSRIQGPCCLQAEEFLGVPLTPPKKGDAFPTPGRRQCTHKYIMVWDVFWEFPAFWVSYGPREDIPPLTSDQSEKLIVFRERIPSRIQGTVVRGHERELVVDVVSVKSWARVLVPLMICRL
ncbi:hypothetical protein TNCV_1036481 [Trichonephila clavipes]|nr:hypothetical protein TNCV_1036481 [Trichonephila clavipes]